MTNFLHTLEPGRRRLLVSTAATLALALVSLLFAFPFLWMFLSTFKSNLEIFTPLKLMPESFHLEHYRRLLLGGEIPYIRQYGNSLFAASAQTAGAVAVSLGAGYLLGRYAFPWRRLLLVLAVLTVLLPKQVLVLPLFLWMNRLGLLDTPASVILPGTVTGIGILYFTLVFRRVPQHLLDAARLEGAGEYRTFLTALPLVKPAALTYALVHFILAWHEHILPLVMLTSEEKMTLPVALSSLYGGSMRMPYALLMAGSLLTVAPTAALYLLLRRHFRSSLAELTSR